MVLGRAYAFTGRSEFADMLCHMMLTNTNQQPSGLWHHADHSSNAWSRGNGFSCAGHAEALHYLPKDHPRYDELAARHNNHVRALIAVQGEDGTWHQLVDDPTSFHELTSTGLIGYAISRGLTGGWLDPQLIDSAHASSHAICQCLWCMAVCGYRLTACLRVQACVDRAFMAVRSRIDAAGHVKGGCQSTGPLPSREKYLEHPILDDVIDDRSGSMAYWFAVAYETLQGWK